MKTEAADLSFDDISVGDTFSFERVITEEDGRNFAALSGDVNPLHTDPIYGAQSPFGHMVTHGMFVGALFSTLVGMYCPGKRNLYLSQTMQFKQPLSYGVTYTVRSTVVRKVPSLRMVILTTELVDQEGAVLVSGEAQTKVL